MNSNLLLFNSISSRQADCSYSKKKQVNLGLNNFKNKPTETQKYQYLDSFIKKYQNTVNTVFLSFIMPKNYPYKHIKNVFVPITDLVKMKIKGEPAVIKSGNVNLNCWFIR
ncbi:MAG: hypothetical protein WC197_04525, partial [Candidatus Gastranaerophilaceae bacterium]